jgi:hypothetical protein
MVPLAAAATVAAALAPSFSRECRRPGGPDVGAEERRRPTLAATVASPSTILGNRAAVCWHFICIIVS